jgi:hypothetical protein
MSEILSEQTQLLQRLGLLSVALLLVLSQVELLLHVLIRLVDDVRKLKNRIQGRKEERLVLKKEDIHILRGKEKIPVTGVFVTQKGDNLILSKPMDARSSSAQSRRGYRENGKEVNIKWQS